MGPRSVSSRDLNWALSKQSQCSFWAFSHAYPSLLAFYFQTTPLSWSTETHPQSLRPKESICHLQYAPGSSLLLFPP